jgi:hypothetical protein
MIFIGAFGGYLDFYIDDNGKVAYSPAESLTGSI